MSGAGQECRVNSARRAHLARAISTMLSRRVLAGALGLGMLGLPGLVEAKKKKRKRYVGGHGFLASRGGDGGGEGG